MECILTNLVCWIASYVIWMSFHLLLFHLKWWYTAPVFQFGDVVGFIAAGYFGGEWEWNSNKRNTMPRDPHTDRTMI